MAQLSANSQRTAGIETGGTQSALLQAVREAGAYATLLARALRELEWRQAQEKLKEQPELEERQPAQVSIQQHDDRPALKGAAQKQLPPAPDGTKVLPPKPPLAPFTPEEIQISRKEDLRVAVRIGEYYIEDTYRDLDSRFDEMPLPQQQALAVALSGSPPLLEVSITVTDQFDNQAKFLADPQQNQGWIISERSEDDLSPQAIEADLQRQHTSGVKNIKQTMRTFKPEGGPDIFRGKTLSVLTDGDEVIVIDSHSGIIRDVERLEEIGNLGQQAVRKSALEAAGAFGIKGSAAKGVAPHRKHKQRELTL